MIAEASEEWVKVRLMDLAVTLRPDREGPQLRTRRAVDSWVWLGATEGLVAAGGMRL